MTLEQIILLFKDVAARHKQINGFVVSEDYNLGEIDDNDFPLLAIVPTSPNLPRDENGFSMFTTDFEIKLLDLVNDDLDNKINVYSDSIEILKDIVNEFATHPYYMDLGIDIISDASMTKLDGFTDLDLYGYGTELTLASPNKISFCGSPITNLSGFNFDPASVTITDGATTVELYPSDTYTCQAVAVCDDATVENSDASYTDTVASGGTLVLADETIQVTDENGNVLSTTASPLYENLVIEVPVAQAPLVVNDWFEFIIDTTISGATASDTFTLFNISGSVSVDWENDSNITHISDITGASDPRLVHVFSTGGVKTIRIKGSGSMAGTSLDRLKVTSVENCGEFVFNIVNFYNYENLVWNAIDEVRTSISTLNNSFRNTSITNSPVLKSAFITKLLNTFQTSSLNDDLGYMDLRRCTTLNNFASGVTAWSQANYSATLLGWLRWDSITHAPEVGWVLQSGVPLHGGNNTVAIKSETALARTYLISTLGLTITDGGEV